MYPNKLLGLWKDKFVEPLKDLSDSKQLKVVPKLQFCGVGTYGPPLSMSKCSRKHSLLFLLVIFVNSNGTQISVKFLGFRSFMERPEQLSLNFG